jgi:hypothetical protein
MKMVIMDIENKALVFQGEPKTAEEIGEVNKRWPSDNKKYKRVFV